MASQNDNQQNTKTVKCQYELKKYIVRSMVTLVGPWLVFGFYLYICLGFLIRSPNNGIVPYMSVDGRWVFYIWFILAVFVLDWSRTGLANIEAAALMHPRLAPCSAAQLMWHTDTKWANPLWWLRAIRAMLSKFRAKRKNNTSVLSPGYLWLGLSLSFVLVFVSLPLSGLTMEFSQVKTYSNQQAAISGPNETSFNYRANLNLIPNIRNDWSSGRAPRNRSTIYAPDGTEAVSSTYFEDRAADHAATIEFFAGPAVGEPVHGNAWGLHGSVSCAAVRKEELKMLRIDGEGGGDVSIYGCVSADTPCQTRWYSNLSEIDSRSSKTLVTIPVWLNESGVLDKSIYEFVAAADGFFDLRNLRGSPYIYDSNHDSFTMDHIISHRAQNATTTAMFELSLWQMNQIFDEVSDGLVNGTIPGPVDVYNILGQNYTRISVHCDIVSEVGWANVDPAHRTYSSFRRSRAEPVPQIPKPATDTLIKHDLQPPQVLALQALAQERNPSDLYASLMPVNYRDSPNDEQRRQTWSAFHDSINSLPISSDTIRDNYHVMTPYQLQHSIYRLLGESFIAMMDAGGVDVWRGDLYSLEDELYLVRGVVSWKYVLALLGIWALVMSVGSTWMLFFAGKRWAKTLDGLEMFKLGAQFTHEVNGFESTNLAGCRDALKNVPGMIGILPGTGVAGDHRLGFIGLSENVVSQDAVYTLDRRQAAQTRPFI